jgi:hypothetical protein
MATPADQRLTELLERWLTSLELHLKYSSLDDDTYWKVQPWVEHQRPARWIVELAREKTAALKALVGERIKAGDTKFSDALEEMMFLANLVGLQHIERFIPVAEPANERGTAGSPDPASTTGTREMPRPSTGATGTREMPRPPVKPDRKPKPGARAAAKARQGAPARPAPPRPAPPQPAPRSAGPAVPPLPTPPPPAPEIAQQQVIADAKRLLQWGRRWFELAELIARIADRPPVREVTRILNENRSHIEKALAQPKPGR